MHPSLFSWGTVLCIMLKYHSVVRRCVSVSVCVCVGVGVVVDEHACMYAAQSCDALMAF